MEEFVTEFDLTNQQIVFLNEIDIVPVPPNNDLSDFVHCTMDEGIMNDECEPFEENSENAKKSDGFNDVHQHQFHIIQDRNGIRHMKFKKPKKMAKKSYFSKKPVDLQQCTMCDAIFTSKIKLKKHIQAHTFRKKHQCDFCCEEFNVLENLTLHISLHKGDGRCPQCGKC